MPVLMFGSISVVADTSELQRGAFNDAFAHHGLDWTWEREYYQSLLLSNGGAQRIADEAERRGETVDAEAVHHSKSERFRELLAAVRTTPRPGVRETIDAAKAAGWQVAFVTTTSPENVPAVLKATNDKVTAADFDLVTDVSQVKTAKPDPEVYEFALSKLGVQPGDCIAVEDNVGGVASARAAGIPVVAFPNENTVTHDFGETPCVYRLDFSELAAYVSQDHA